MDILLIILLTITVAGFAVIFWLLTRKPKDREQDKSILMLQNQLNEVNRTLDNKLGESTKMMQQQFGQALKSSQELTEKLVKLEETNQQVKGFAEQLQNLQDILKNPKQRGVLGEYYLETVLKNVLPPSAYQMQYSFKDGSIVDAVVFVQNKIIPIDAKFSLENYNKILQTTDQTERERLEKLFKQDLKNRIDETAKYIKPGEKTMDFAFMFIPAEAIYYDLLVNQVGAVKVSTRDLIEYAFQEKRVIIVSPTSFFAYLQTVLQGLRALQIEEQAQEIRKNIEKLGRHILNYEDYFKKLGIQLGTTVNTYNLAGKEFKKIDKDVFKITEKDGKIEVLEIDKPKLE